MLEGSPHPSSAVLSGGLDLAEAETHGLRLQGSRESLLRVLPAHS